MGADFQWRLPPTLSRSGLTRITPIMCRSHRSVFWRGARTSRRIAAAPLHTINTRLDASAIAFQLQHGGAKVLITDREFSPVISHALAALPQPPLVIDVDDPEYAGEGDPMGVIEYEALLETGDP